MKEKHARAALAGLPASIRVANIDWTIDVSPDEDNDFFGQWRPVSETIFIDATIISPHRVVEVFLHEVLHAVYNGASLQDGDEEERVVTAMAKGIATVCRDNPWFPKWITKHSA